MQAVCYQYNFLIMLKSFPDMSRLLSSSSSRSLWHTLLSAFAWSIRCSNTCSCICIAVSDNILSINIAFLLPVSLTNLHCSCPISCPDSAEHSIHQNLDDEFCSFPHQDDYLVEFTFVCTWFLRKCYENRFAYVFRYVTTVVDLIYYFCDPVYTEIV